MRFITIVDAFSTNGISRFAFTAVSSIYDSEVILESRGYKKLVVELDFISRGIKKCLKISKGKIKLTVGSSYGTELPISENDTLAIMMSTVNLNNLMLGVNHTMRGDAIYDFNSEYVYVLSDYLRLMVSIITKIN